MPCFWPSNVIRPLFIIFDAFVGFMCLSFNIYKYIYIDVLKPLVKLCNYFDCQHCWFPFGLNLKHFERLGIHRHP